MAVQSEIDCWLSALNAAHEAKFDSALREIEAGQKTSHWMWFMFPQAKGLGKSATSLRFEVRSLAHGEAFLGHPVLGANFARVIGAARSSLERSNQARKVAGLFGDPDDRKFVSSITLMGELSRRVGMVQTASDCEACLVIARADGMPKCSITQKFLQSEL